MSNRITRRHTKAKDLDISAGTDISTLFNNFFRSTWRVTADEQEFIEQKLDEREIELLTCESCDFAEKRRALKTRNRLVNFYHKRKDKELALDGRQTTVVEGFTTKEID